MTKELLYIGNDVALYNAFKLQLSAMDFTLKKLSSANKLLNKLHRSKPDMLIMDFIQDDLNGGAICHQLKCDPKTNDLPVIILSEYTGMERYTSKFGCDAILNKLNANSNIINTIVKVFNNKRSVLS
jgi:CheY-like chemotaxis protein